jgi:excisionase family DNA binding protein
MEEVLAVGVKEAARRLGVCERTVMNAIYCKELTSRKIGRRRVIPVSALESFLRRDHDLSTKRAPDAGRTVSA